ncbi:Polymerase/histidinol phosphatase-like protein [Talaromyces proteolyticus]|uniref:Histidinol-phosphatase n=1 Tax=Talaromyces proteolyticus TaxID=1131652 RepID=A0AAD4PVM4_9EURO|nr:Polymerase/histidinol phosphatase-like protein [Talaromyces proteolyticus]KAH8690863.1 Polymerase/histidinol phosphatase-like protein [Talaromyces proteolyticus]
MPFSHHSHSGQFCPGHAKNSLEEVIQTAIKQGMQVFCLTEHMPPFFAEALRLREKYASQIKLLIGFEIDWIRPESLTLIETSLSRFPFELLVGSVHHVHTIPIDYDAAMYGQAREAAGGTDERLFEDYYDSQLDMLQKLKPPVVGHFDLVRLKSDDPNATFTKYPRVWEKIRRNLQFVASYGGMLELNSAALRKGMSEPYPKAEICKEFLSMGGRFCLSDDSHGIDQVGFGYREVLDFIDRTGITAIHYLELTQDGDAPDTRFPSTKVCSLSVEEVKNKASFWL